ncbi:MAG TPA: hypothetical protein DCS48_07810 [Desulfovibrio sp.]|nr:hypothetical protein [Desulfovibrio sp.]
MFELEFQPVKEFVTTCPACNRLVKKISQSGGSIEFTGEATLTGGDTLPIGELPSYDRRSEYNVACVFYECECGLELAELELCVPSETDPNREFWYDGFEIAERAELLRVPGSSMTWHCIRKHNVDDRMGNFSRLYKRFDLHYIGPFVADFAPSNDGTPMKVWKDAEQLLIKYGPACLEYMREWRKEAGDA